MEVENMCTNKKSKAIFVSPNQRVKVRIVHSPNHQSVESLTTRLSEAMLNVDVVLETGEDGDFEYYVGDKLIFSGRQLTGSYPYYVTKRAGLGSCFRASARSEPDGRELPLQLTTELVEITRWLSEGRTDLHLYMCSFAAGGIPNMETTDIHNTPAIKKIVDSCTIA